MTTTLTRRRARERDHDQPSLFSQVLAPPPLRDEPPREAPLRTESWPEDSRHEAAHVEAPAAPSEAPSARTLDEALTALWDELSAGTAIDCPVCGGAMEPRHSAGAGMVGGRCGSCASTLA